jgi:NAD(P)-dependent dehydrogenase (short-subunit alcohol dehydrogenase family)
MKIQDSVALVTGANRGLGLAFVRALIARGARKVYVGARDPSTVTLAGVEPIRLDVTNPADLAAAVDRASDVQLLVNNAGIVRGSALLGPDAIAGARAEFETNVIGPLAVSRAFAPVLARNGGGAILNVLSVASWVTLPRARTYSASKAAAWSLTNGLRAELHEQGTHVVALHVGFVDTDMTNGIPVAKSRPEDVVETALGGLEAGELEILADGTSRQIKQALSQGVYLHEPELR